MPLPFDTVTLRGLKFNITVGPDAWGRQKPQPVEISLEVSPPETFEAAAAGDDVSMTLDYGKLYKKVCNEFAEQNVYAGTMDVIEKILSALPDHWIRLQLDIRLPKSLLRAEQGLRYLLTLDRSSETNDAQQQMSVGGIRCACVVGVNPHERLVKQIVMVNLSFQRTILDRPRSEHLPTLPDWPYNDIVRIIAERVEGSSYQTVEALASAIAQTLTVNYGISPVIVEVEKPNAIAGIEAAGVRIHRERDFFTERDFWKVQYP